MSAAPYLERRNVTERFGEFGVSRAVGGDFNVLALDIDKRVVGQRNFAMGAVVSAILLAPAVFALAVNRWATARQVALLSACAVLYEPAPDPKTDCWALAFCATVAGFLLLILLISHCAALIRFWPCNHELTLKPFSFERVDGGGWGSYWNSLGLAFHVATIGAGAVFVGGFLVEKGRGFDWARTARQFLATMPMAIPGMALGLACIFAFGDPANPFDVLYGTMAILVISTITHFYKVSHLTALKTTDRECEPASAPLRQPVTRVFSQVATPVCTPTLLDIASHFLVNAMATVSAVALLYAPHTTLAALDMHDAGQIPPAAAMCMLIISTDRAARGAHALLSRAPKRTQPWPAR